MTNPSPARPPSPSPASAVSCTPTASPSSTTSSPHKTAPTPPHPPLPYAIGITPPPRHHPAHGHPRQHRPHIPRRQRLISAPTPRRFTRVGRLAQLARAHGSHP